MGRRKAQAEDEEVIGEESTVEGVGDVDVPDPNTQICLEGVGDDHDVIAAPEGWERDRRLTIDGRNYEHVSEDSSGRWVYRRM